MWPARQRLVRVITDEVGATELAHPSRPRRFAPFLATDGARVEVLYAGSSQRCALAETVFHDTPDDLTVEALIDSSTCFEQRMSVLAYEDELPLADFTDDALRGLAVTRAQLIGGGFRTYPDTAQWGAAAHAAGFVGMVWNSRRSPADLSLVLFGDRINRRRLAVVEAPLPLATGAHDRVSGFELVQRLAEELNVTLR